MKIGGGLEKGAQLIRYRVLGNIALGFHADSRFPDLLRPAVLRTKCIVSSAAFRGQRRKKTDLEEHAIAQVIGSAEIRSVRVTAEQVLKLDRNYSLRQIQAVIQLKGTAPQSEILLWGSNRFRRNLPGTANHRFMAMRSRSPKGSSGSTPGIKGSLRSAWVNW